MSEPPAPYPMRELTDPRMLRALAHPLRLRLLNALVLHGPATATELAERIDDTPANCSWHLRQLARFGFIEESAGGKGRNRPWRWVPAGNRFGSPDEPPELAVASAELTRTWLHHEMTQRDAWEQGRSSEPIEWRRAAFTTQSLTWLTAGELAELNQQVTALLLAYSDRLSDPGRRPVDARPVRLVAWAVPTG